MKKTKGLSDNELAIKYESGSINLSEILQKNTTKVLSTPIYQKQEIVITPEGRKLVISFDLSIKGSSVAAINKIRNR